MPRLSGSRSPRRALVRIWSADKPAASSSAVVIMSATRRNGRVGGEFTAPRMGAAADTSARGTETMSISVKITPGLYLLYPRKCHGLSVENVAVSTDGGEGARAAALARL